MLAVVKKPATQGVTMANVPLPRFGPEEALVRVRAVGICGSDHRIYADTSPARQAHILGHEVAGEVVAVGGRVASVAPGDRVGIEICLGCSRCRYCVAGRVNLCDDLKEVGITVDGGMTEYVAVSACNLHTLPNSVSFRKGVLADPLACALHGLELAYIQPGSWVAIVGPGQMGLLAAQIAKRRYKARVIVVGTSAERLATASAVGADHVLNVNDVDVVNAVRDISDGGADVVYEAAGRITAIEPSVSMARKGATIIMVTVHRQAQLDLELVVRRELRLLGAICYRPPDYREAIRMLASGEIEVSPLLNNVFSLQEAQNAFSFVLTRRGLKAILFVPSDPADKA